MNKRYWNTHDSVNEIYSLFANYTQHEGDKIEHQGTNEANRLDESRNEPEYINMKPRALLISSWINETISNIKNTVINLEAVSINDWNYAENILL